LISEFLSKSKETYFNNDIKTVAYLVEKERRILHIKNRAKSLIPNKIKVFLKRLYLKVP
jgi:hypothetical protein